MTRVLLFGGSGQVGTAIRDQSTEAWQLIAPTSTELSLLTSSELIQEYVRQQQPNVIINAAALTRVDDAEAESDNAFAINATAPEAMALAAREVGARFIHLSTDYVFDGLGDLPYAPDAESRPLNVYGRSKRAGEQRVLAVNTSAVIVRTAWVHSGMGANFVGTAVRILSSNKPMQVVDDQVGAPTRASNLAQAIFRVVDRPTLSGILHFTDAGVASWYDVAYRVLETIKAHADQPITATVTPVSSSAFPRAAKRPRVSLLDTHETAARIEWTPPHWSVGVEASAREWLKKVHDA